MANTTKLALEASLKELLRTKPIDKITINDLTEHCGISRMAFYYHFKDIYDLVEWACVEDGKRALQDKKTYDTWQEGISQIFEAVLENKPFIMNVYHAVAREKVEQYLYKLTYELIVHVVEEKCKDVEIADEDKSFIADFYKYGFVGIMLDWIDKGMQEDYHKIVQMMGTATLRGRLKILRMLSKNRQLIKTRELIKILSVPSFCKWFLFRELVNISVSKLSHKQSVE